MIDRVKARLLGEKVADEVLEELIWTAKDRVGLRVGEDTYPTKLDSITVEIVVKMYRRLYFEGLVSEGAGGLNQSFIQDIMAEYDNEFSQYMKKKTRRVKFL